VNVSYYPINNSGLFGYLKHIVLLRVFLKKNKLEIVHAHYGLCGIVALMASRREKVVVSFMGDDLLGSNRFDGKQTIGSKFLVKLNLFFSQRFYDYSIVKSSQMLGEFKNPVRISLCPNGVNLTVFYHVEKTLANQKAGFPSANINIIFVSDPSRAEKNYSLAQKAIDLLNDKSLILHTIYNIANQDLKYFYSASDLLIMTSFHEGSPNVIKEAMACNCPIVTTNVGDVKEVIGDTEGCYISSFDPIDVVEKVKLALKFSKEHGQTKGRERIIKLGLDSETIARKIIEVYNKVLKITD
jgi:glycosyltransferase involved in cell wall biosynthesis